MSAMLLGLWEWSLALEPLKTLRTLELSWSGYMLPNLLALLTCPGFMPCRPSPWVKPIENCLVTA